VCGIVGQIGPKACDHVVLSRMMGMLTHRGPDEAGLLLSEGLALGHLRLSIIDLQSGQQPMSSHDGRFWIVYNGEIFNYCELRKELECKGHVFRNRSDTEVLINSYRQWGVGALDRFNGQWAFCLWDRAEKSFLLARDRWGVRPLFYTRLSDGRTLAFASELKALLADERISRSWCAEALRDILVCWVPESSRSPLQSIHQLPAGHYMTVKEGQQLQVRPWWSVDFAPEYIEWNRPLEEWCERLRQTLSEACNIRMRADVPVGAYLSGGMDSSVIASLLRKNHPGMQTFSITFSDEGFDESRYQKMMSSHLGTKHTAVRITRRSIAEDFERVIWYAETPLYRTAAAPMMRLSNEVRSAGIKVVLTGEGADELLGGYDQFKEDKIRRFWASHPDSAWRKLLLQRVTGAVPHANPRTRAFWYAFYGQGLDQTDRPGFSHHLRWRNGLSLLPLLAASRDDSDTGTSSFLSHDWIAEIEKTVPSGFDRWGALAKSQYWESRQLLSGYLLSSQGDRMAMANSVEGRFPFLDVGLYELSRRMPPNLKLRALTEKFILRRAFARDLPSEITRRTKNAYRAPDALALYHGPLRERLLDSLSPAGVKRRGLFDSEAIEKLLVRVSSNTAVAARDNMALVLAYSSHLFHDLFIEGSISPQQLPPVRTYVDLRLVSANTH
jgi:asparagine synthase (glutamine-hydrolysing)